MQNVDIWVSPGGFGSPYYQFYTDSAGLNELSQLVFSRNNQYTFRRLNNAGSHPFYIRALNPGLGSAEILEFSGDGTIANGIVGEEAFSVQVVDSSLDGIALEYFCTAHPSMKGAITFSGESIPPVGPPSEDSNSLSTIGRLYTAAFGRKADDAGIQFWLDIVNDPLVNYKDVASYFIESGEFSSLVPSDASNQLFVKVLYQNVLSRVPDSIGLGFWSKQLDSGLLDRPEVLIGFANSPENIALYEIIS